MLLHFLLFSFSRCKALYLPSDPTRLAQALQAKARVHKLPVNFPLAQLSFERHYPALLLSFMEWLSCARGGLAETPQPAPGCTPSPLRISTNQWFTNDGQIAVTRHEAYAMELCNAVIRGYGFRHLGTEKFPGVYLRSCAGQFEHKLDHCVLDGREHTHVSSVSPLVRHEHAGQPCTSNHLFFGGTSSRVNLLMNRATERAVSTANFYVSSFSFPSSYLNLFLHFS